MELRRAGAGPPPAAAGGGTTHAGQGSGEQPVGAASLSGGHEPAHLDHERSHDVFHALAVLAKQLVGAAHNLRRWGTRGGGGSGGRRGGIEQVKAHRNTLHARGCLPEQAAAQRMHARVLPLAPAGCARLRVAAALAQRREGRHRLARRLADGAGAAGLQGMGQGVQARPGAVRGTGGKPGAGKGGGAHALHLQCTQHAQRAGTLSSKATVATPLTAAAAAAAP